jgi:uncharacterized protein YyaL (SSP411 family)
MKNILTFFFSLCALLAAAQDGVKWYKFEDAVAQCKKNPKPLFIDLYTDWCGWCKVMDKNTFNQPSIAAYLNTNYYPVKFNAETRDTIRFENNVLTGGGSRSTPHQLAIMLLGGQMSYPTAVVLNYKNKQFQAIHKFQGYQQPEQFAPMMAFIIKVVRGEAVYDQPSFDAFSKTFKLDGAAK